MLQTNLKAGSSSVSEQLNCNLIRTGSDRNATEQAEVEKLAISSREESQDCLRAPEQVSLPPVKQGSLPPFKFKLSSSIPSGDSNESKHLQRIRQLEIALEQSFNYLHELKQQLTEKHLLEDQLAAAEAFANLQQQAITKLKQQLAQKYILQAQLQQAYWEVEQERDRSIQLNLQNDSLQEKILQQYQQLGEYAVAVQYWKKQALQLKAALVSISILPDCAVALSQLPPKVRSIVSEYVAAAALKSPSLSQQSSQVDLLPFLKQ